MIHIYGGSNREQLALAKKIASLLKEENFQRIRLESLPDGGTSTDLHSGDEQVLSGLLQTTIRIQVTKP